MTTAIVRLLFAVAISPIVPGFVLWTIDSVWKTTISGAGWIYLSALVGYPSLIVLGLPLCYFFLRRDWLKLWHFLALGGAVGFLAFFIFDLVVVLIASFSKPAVGVSHGQTELAWIQYLLDEFVAFIQDFAFALPIVALCGSIAAACFWAIMRPSFGAWRQWYAKK